MIRLTVFFFFFAQLMLSKPKFRCQEIPRRLGPPSKSRWRENKSSLERNRFLGPWWEDSW